MEIRKGDRVKFLNDTGGGIVTLVEKEVVHVRSEDGFIFPISRKEIIVISDNELDDENKPENDIIENDFVAEFAENQDDIIDFDEQENDVDDNEINICAAFVQDDDSSEKINLYLINDSGFDLLFNVLALWDNQWGTVETGTLESNTKVHLSAFMLSDLSAISAIMLQGILFKKGVYTPYEPIDETIKLRTSRFFKKNSFVENDYFEDDAIVINFLEEVVEEDAGEELTIDEIKKMLEEKQEIKPEAKPVTKIESSSVFEIKEVDLHIQKLIENYVGMSNSEILMHQMSHFRAKIEGAMLDNTRKIVFIHGVGNGTLKHEIRKTLVESYTDLKFQDASFMEYGYGATLVFLK